MGVEAEDGLDAHIPSIPQNRERSVPGSVPELVPGLVPVPGQSVATLTLAAVEPLRSRLGRCRFGNYSGNYPGTDPGNPVCHGPPFRSSGGGRRWRGCG